MIQDIRIIIVIAPLILSWLLIIFTALWGQLIARATTPMEDQQFFAKLPMEDQHIFAKLHMRNRQYIVSVLYIIQLS
jgi:hypothetical protein